MLTQLYPLEPYFRQTVRNGFERELGIYNPALLRYITLMLCEFSNAGTLYRVYDEYGRPLKDPDVMICAADRVYGLASSFFVERETHRKIGDFAMIVAGLYPGAIPEIGYVEKSYDDIIEIGKQSYQIVSSFNCFEFEEEAPIFLRLSEGFERIVFGLAMISDELLSNNLLPRPDGWL